MSAFGYQGGAGTYWGNPYGGRYYSPSGVLTNAPSGTGGVFTSQSPLDAIANLAYAAQSGGDSLGSSSPGSQSTNSGRGPGAGPAMGALTSMGVGYLGSQAGLPGWASGMVGSLAGKGVAKGEVTVEDIANTAIFGGLKAAVPAIFSGPVGLAVGLGLGLLGFNPAQGLGEMLGMYEGLAPGYEGGFFGTQGKGLGISGGLPGFDIGPSPEGFDEGEASLAYMNRLNKAAAGHHFNK